MGGQEELVDRVVTSLGLCGVRESWDWPDQENLLVGLCSEASGYNASILSTGLVRCLAASPRVLHWPSCPTLSLHPVGQIFPWMWEGVWGHLAEVGRGLISGVQRKDPRRPSSHKSQRCRQRVPQPGLPA